MSVDSSPRRCVPDPACVTEEVGSERACDTLLMCIVTVMNHGLRNGGGVGDVLRKPSKNVPHRLPSTHLYTFCLLNICTPPIFYTSIHLLHIYTPSIIYTCIHLLSSPHLYTFYHLHIYTTIIYTPIISKSIHLLSSIHLQSSSHLYTFYHLHIYSHSINYTSIHLLSSAYLCTFYHLYIYAPSIISTSLPPTCRWPCRQFGVQRSARG